jgi:hypothetical protein
MFCRALIYSSETFLDWRHLGGRYLLDNVDHLYVGLPARICDTNNCLPALISLLKSRPWERKSMGKLERFLGGTWQTVRTSNTTEVCQVEGQVSFLGSQFHLPNSKMWSPAQYTCSSKFEQCLPLWFIKLEAGALSVNLQLNTKRMIVAPLVHHSLLLYCLGLTENDGIWQCNDQEL